MVSRQVKSQYNFNQLASRMGITIHTNLDEVYRRRLINRYQNADYRNAQVKKAFGRDIKKLTRSFTKRVNPLTTKGRVPHRVTNLPRQEFDLSTIGTDGQDWGLGTTFKPEKAMASRGTVGSKIFQTELQTPPEILSMEGDIQDRPGFWKRTLRWLRGR